MDIQSLKRNGRSILSLTSDQLKEMDELSKRYPNSKVLLTLLRFLAEASENTHCWANRIVEANCTEENKNMLQATKDLKESAQIGLIEAKFMIEYYVRKKFPPK